MKTSLDFPVLSQPCRDAFICLARIIVYNEIYTIYRLKNRFNCFELITGKGRTRLFSKSRTGNSIRSPPIIVAQPQQSAWKSFIDVNIEPRFRFWFLILHINFEWNHTHRDLLYAVVVVFPCRDGECGNGQKQPTQLTHRSHTKHCIYSVSSFYISIALASRYHHRKRSALYVENRQRRRRKREIMNLSFE